MIVVILYLDNTDILQHGTSLVNLSFEASKWYRYHCWRYPI